MASLIHQLCCIAQLKRPTTVQLAGRDSTGWIGAAGRCATRNPRKVVLMLQRFTLTTTRYCTLQSIEQHPRKSA